MTGLRDRIEAVLTTATDEGSNVVSVEAIRGALDGDLDPPNITTFRRCPYCLTPVATPEHIDACQP